MLGCLPDGRHGPGEDSANVGLAPQAEDQCRSSRRTKSFQSAGGARVTTRQLARGNRALYTRLELCDRPSLGGAGAAGVAGFAGGAARRPGDYDLWNVGAVGELATAGVERGDSG